MIDDWFLQVNTDATAVEKPRNEKNGGTVAPGAGGTKTPPAPTPPANTASSNTRGDVGSNTSDPLERFAPPRKGHVNQKFELPPGTLRLGPRQCAITCRDTPTCQAYAVKISTGECVLSTATSSWARGNKVQAWEFYDKCSVSPTDCSGGTAAQVLKNSGSGGAAVTKSTTAVPGNTRAGAIGQQETTTKGDEDDAPDEAGSPLGAIIAVIAVLCILVAVGFVVVHLKRNKDNNNDGGNDMFGMEERQASFTNPVCVVPSVP